MALFDFLKKHELDKIKELESKLERFSKIEDLEKEAKQIKEISAREIAAKENDFNLKKEEINELSSAYSKSLEVYKKLRQEISIYETKAEMLDYGLYEPVYNFEHSDDYRNERDRMIKMQKDLVRKGDAAVCYKEWAIDGSIAKGRANANRIIKLVLYAFNGECASLISKVKWNNIDRLRKRIEKAYDTINKLSESNAVQIQSRYLGLKINELTLEHEYQLKKQKEKEEQRAIREQIREEEKARKEYEKAQRESEKEEKTYQKALDKARKEMLESTGEKHIKLQLHIEKLERELKEANYKKERALSMAQQTTIGHVYVISNIGAFGENVYKIGLTRRLEPTDRVHELGNASVPFKFDIHAMIYSEDAPSLEKRLHHAFVERKINMVNSRKEFFNVTLDEIEAEVDRMGLGVEFIKFPEAMEYRETLAILESLNAKEELQTLEEEIAAEFPSSL